MVVTKEHMGAPSVARFRPVIRRNDQRAGILAAH